MGRRSNGQQVEHWKSMIAAKAASKQTVAEFCREQGIADHVYYYWRRRINGSAGRKTVKEEPDADNEGFVELVPGRATSSGVRVRLGAQSVIDIILDPGFDSKTLQQALAVLQESVSCSR
jgi:transposase-like protein